MNTKLTYAMLKLLIVVIIPIIWASLVAKLMPTSCRGKGQCCVYMRKELCLGLTDISRGSNFRMLVASRNMNQCCHRVWMECQVLAPSEYI